MCGALIWSAFFCCIWACWSELYRREWPVSSVVGFGCFFTHSENFFFLLAFLFYAVGVFIIHHEHFWFGRFYFHIEQNSSIGVYIFGDLITRIKKKIPFSETESGCCVSQFHNSQSFFSFIQSIIASWANPPYLRISAWELHHSGAFNFATVIGWIALILGDWATVGWAFCSVILGVLSTTNMGHLQLFYWVFCRCIGRFF